MKTVFTIFRKVVLLLQLIKLQMAQTAYQMIDIDCNEILDRLLFGIGLDSVKESSDKK